MTVLLISRPWKHPKTGIYYFRRAVPAELRPFAAGGVVEPRHEYKRSLHTKIESAARGLHRDAAAACDDYFAVLRTRKEAALAASTPHQPGPSTSLSPSPLPGHLSGDDLRSLAAELGGEIVERNAGKPPPASAFKAARSMPNFPGPWGTPTEPWSGHRYALELSRRTHMRGSQQPYVGEPCRTFLEARKVVLSADQWEAFCDVAREAIDSALETLQRIYRGDNSTPPLSVRFAVGAPASRPKVSVTGLIEVWAAGREFQAETRTKFARRLQQFSVFLKHDDALAVTAKDLRRWRAHLRNNGLSVKTINHDCIATLKTVFRAAASEDVLTGDPFPGSFALKEDRTKEKPRRAYTDAEAGKLLSAARERTDVLRWLPWLMAYTGARISEVAQLRKEDVMIEAGIRFLRITPSTDTGQRVKTASSRRDVPLHPALSAEGFLRFVTKAKAGPLFPDLPPGPHGNRGVAASTNYRRWARKTVGITDKRATAHSWRHRMMQQFTGVEATEAVADAILGHAPAGQRRTYDGDGPPLKVKAKLMAKVPAVKVGKPSR